MKHIKAITVARADAITDFWNDIWRAWLEFKIAKKNELGL